MNRPQGHLLDLYLRDRLASDRLWAGRSGPVPRSKTVSISERELGGQTNEYARMSHIPNYSPTLEIGASIHSSPPVQFDLLDMAAQQQQVASLDQKAGYLGR